MITAVEKGLLIADLNRPLNLFTGAGFSTLAKNAAGDPLPLGGELKSLLVKNFGLDAYSSLDLPSLYAVLLADRRDALRSFLEEIYTTRWFDPKYDSLRSLNITSLYTTNIDDLPFHIFDARTGGQPRVLHDLTLYGAPRRPDDVVTFVPLHGNVRHENADFLFTPGQISSAFASDRETWYVFQRELEARPTLFLGYGMHDAGVLQALHSAAASQLFNRWVLLRDGDDASVKLYNSLGFHVIVGEISDFLTFLSDELEINGRHAAPPQAARLLRSGTRDWRDRSEAH